MKKEEGLEGKKKKSLDFKLFLFLTLIAMIVSFVLLRLIEGDKSINDTIEWINLIGLPKLGLLFLGFVTLVFVVFWILENKDNWKIKFVAKSIARFWVVVCVLFTFSVFFLLGSLHGIYGYESTIETDLNTSLGIMGNPFYHSFYERAESNPIMWLIIFFVIFIGSILFWISDVIGYYKEHLTKEKPQT